MGSMCRSHPRPLGPFLGGLNLELCASEKGDLRYSGIFLYDVHSFVGLSLDCDIYHQ